MSYILPNLIERAAERYPVHDAFRCGNRAVTYSQLLTQMNQLAHLLIDLGVQRGDRIGVYLNRSLETAVAVYGIMQAGAAFVPLDPKAPVSRTQLLIQDCGIQHIISQPAQRKSLQSLIETEALGLKSIIGLSEDWPVRTISWAEVQQLPTQDSPQVRILEKDLAYIMYTSGTTGTPKGIMHTHHSGLSYAKLSASLYGLTHEDRVGNHAALHFDIATFGYFSAPLVGATTVIVPDAHTQMPASLSSLMEAEKLTFWYSVPLALIQLVQRGVLEQRDLRSIRWVLFGGEPFPTKFLRSLMQSWPQAQFSNVYGPAEVNQCTYYHLPTLPETDDPIPLGYVWENTEMLILDEKDEPVAPGETGELLIRTATMMQGYWKRPDLTEKGFYTQIRIPGILETFYRTGDLVRINTDGHLLFLGRKDRQIKTRGYRVELDEVEAVLITHEAVDEAAVFSVQDETFGLLINASVTLKEQAETTEEILRQHIGASLPWYAVPQQIRISQQLPRTAAGKIDRKALQRQASEMEN
ncbi:MAG: amino acid adenylation domain-containing protein [Saprospiraceae bacterium]